MRAPLRPGAGFVSLVGALGPVVRWLVTPLLSLLILVIFVQVASAQTVVTLSGRVTDNLNGSVVGATVDVLGTTASGLTNTSGNYALQVPPGTYDVRTTPPSGSAFSATTITNVSILANTVLDVLLVPASVTFSGVLRDRNAVAVPNQLIRLMGPVELSAQTDATGAFAVSVAPNTYTLGVRRSGSAGSATIPDNFDLSGPSIALTANRVQDLTLQQVLLSVTVVDQASNPIAGASASVGCTSSSFPLFSGGQTGGGVCSSAVTNANGVATVVLFPASSATVVIGPPSGSCFSQTSISGVNVSQDGNLLVSLQCVEQLPSPTATRTSTEARSAVRFGPVLVTPVSGHAAWLCVLTIP